MKAKTDKAKMLAGELYRSADPVLVADAERARRLVAQYNAASGEAAEGRRAAAAPALWFGRRRRGHQAALRLRLWL